MKQLKAFLTKDNNHLDYQNIHHNKAIEQAVYSNIVITCEQSPFDYIDSIEIDESGRVYARIFIEPVGNLRFKGSSLDSFFVNLNALFNSQPPSLDYILAGHKLAYYLTNIRKNFAIDVDFVNVDAIWTIDLEEKETREVSLKEIVKGQDLFDYIRQKNRLTVGILDPSMFNQASVADGMIGEILAVEEMMPDFFKVIIDLKSYEAYNQHILTLSEQEKIPKNQLVELYVLYETTLEESEAIQILQEKDLPIFKQQVQQFYEKGRHEYEFFFEYQKRTSK